MTMWALRADDIELEVAVLRRLGVVLGVQTWPIVLDIDGVLDPPSAESGCTGSGRSARELDHRIAEAGFIADGEPSIWTAAVSRVLAQAERLIEIRVFTATGVGRCCIARHGDDHVLARRAGSSITLRLADIRDVPSLAVLVGAQLPQREPARIKAWSHPAEELVDRVRRCRDDREVADALHAIGADPADVMAYAAALTSTSTRTEIVAVAAGSGAVTQASGAVAVLDTDRGRIVSSPSRSPDGQVWLTLSPGSGHRIEQAIGLLIETLPDGRWFA